MKRPSSSDSLGAFMSICPSTEEHIPNNHVYGREFQSMLEGFDEEGCVEECGGQIGEKKRRLSVHQVKALEKNFEVENKLEPERKVKLAQELGLQPRQVAVWFQNRRARWKTKQLERDYGVLMASYDALKQNCDSLRHENDDLLKEIRELKSKLREEEEEDEDDRNDEETDNSGKEEQIASDSIAKFVEQSAKSGGSLSGSDDAEADLNYETFNHRGAEATLLFPDLKDGSSDSDSSAILNEDNNSPKSASAVSSTGGSLLHSHHVAASPGSSTMLKFGDGSSADGYQFSDPKAVYHPQFVKVEEHNFFGDEACNFFSDEQAPTLQWYTDQWT